MNWFNVLPFFAAALVQLLSLPIQALILRQLATDYDAAYAANEQADKFCPPGFTKVDLRARFSRDFDALACFTYSATIIPAAIAFLNQDRAFFVLALVLACTVPGAGASLVLISNPYSYGERSLVRNQISPFIATSTGVTLTIGLMAGLFGSAAKPWFAG